MNQNDTARVALTALIGAMVGGVAGFLFLTDRGRSALRDFEPAFNSFKDELVGAGRSMQGVTSAAIEGWRLLEEVMGDTRETYRSTTTH